jgi:site-specific DNA recombinase
VLAARQQPGPPRQVRRPPQGGLPPRGRRAGRGVAVFADRIFGPHRRDILAADLAGIDDRVTRDRHSERERLQRAVADVVRRQHSILRQAQDGDLDDPFTKALRGTFNDLEVEKKTALAAIADLDAVDQTEPGLPSAADVALLDALPYLALNLPATPEPLLRRLFEITQLTVRLHDDSDHVTITITLPADQLHKRLLGRQTFV